KKIQGLIVTTDSFFWKKKIRENIVKNFPDGLASDMEGSSVAQVAHHFKVPYTVLTVISDEATDGAGFTFDEVIDEIGNEVGKILINYFESLS
ncbi:MAG: 5'-methylthioadenosine/S-adenosylhomocysteine nucleosidase family protein, partial [Lactococcus cremoris]